MKAFDRGALVRSALIVTRATGITYLAGLIISTVTARSLGPEDFGRYSYVVWLSGVVVICCTNGLTTTGIKFIAECLGREDALSAARVYHLLRRYFLISVVVVLAGLLVALPFVEPAGWRGSLLLLAVVVLLSGLPKGLYLLHSSVGKGYGNFSVEANTTNLSGVLGVMATLVLAATGQPLEVYLLLFVLLGFCHAVLALWLIRRAGIRASSGLVEPAMVGRLNVHLAWTMVLVLLAMVSNRTVETYLLNRTAGAEAVGYFIIAATLVRGGADMLVSGLTAVLLPAMAHSYGQGGHERVNPILANSVRYFSFFGLLLAGVGFLCSDLVVGLMYGPKYAAVGGVLKVMMLMAGLTLSEGAFNAVLITTDNQRLRVVLTTLAVAVAVGLAFALVPRFGLAGAVAGHVASRVVMFATVVVITLRTTGMRLPWGLLGRQFAAAGVAAACAATMIALVHGAWMGLAAAIVYALVLLVCSMAFKAWREQDLAMLGTLAQRYPRIGMALAWAGLR
ncbi:lipopolysaccharide biosynthesis protein [Luteimonas mephitis]|uniref:lipopolysaccharide biosynthesis protein n=1 Tax=Luteimonas mephitis TaxID=83615 RepID=UPI003A8F7CD2